MPNSASCERVFALLKSLFGDEQYRSLKDYIQASLQLNYHGRVVGRVDVSCFECASRNCEC